MSSYILLVCFRVRSVSCFDSPSVHRVQNERGGDHQNRFRIICIANTMTKKRSLDGRTGSDAEEPLSTCECPVGTKTVRSIIGTHPENGEVHHAIEEGQSFSPVPRMTADHIVQNEAVSQHQAITPCKPKTHIDKNMVTPDNAGPGKDIPWVAVSTRMDVDVARADLLRTTAHMTDVFAKSKLKLDKVSETLNELTSRDELLRGGVSFVDENKERSLTSKVDGNTSGDAVCSAVLPDRPLIASSALELEGDSLTTQYHSLAEKASKVEGGSRNDLKHKNHADIDGSPSRFAKKKEDMHAAWVRTKERVGQFTILRSPKAKQATEQRLQLENPKSDCDLGSSNSAGKPMNNCCQQEISPKKVAEKEALGESNSDFMSEDNEAPASTSTADNLVLDKALHATRDLSCSSAADEPTKTCSSQTIAAKKAAAQKAWDQLTKKQQHRAHAGQGIPPSRFERMKASILADWVQTKDCFRRLANKQHMRGGSSNVAGSEDETFSKARKAWRKTKERARLFAPRVDRVFSSCIPRQHMQVPSSNEQSI